MNINDLSLGFLEKNDPKALYERMEKCKKEAEQALSLSRSYNRPIRSGTSFYDWQVGCQMWLLRTPKLINYVPTAIAAEHLAWDLYEGEEWNWNPLSF